MFFRFAVVVVAVIGIALSGIAMEKDNLALRRSISLQGYRRTLLLEERSRLRVRLEGWDAVTLPASPRASGHVAPVGRIAARE